MRRFSIEELLTVAGMTITVSLCSIGVADNRERVRREIVSEQEKSAAVQVMIADGRPQKDIDSLLANWNGNNPPERERTIGEKRAGLAQTLNAQGAKSDSIAAIVSACYP